jgi:hypothetical protein
MTRFFHRKLVNAAALAIGAASFGFNGSAQTAPVAPASSPVLAPSAGERAPASQPAPPKRNRAISAEAAAALAAASPKYTPAPPKPEPKPEAEQIDLRDVDKPKNTIIRLDPYLVREPKPAILTERAVHTRRGLEDIAMRRFISETDRALNRFTLPLFGSSMKARAMAMYEEEERLRNMSDLHDAAVGAAVSDRAAGAYILKEAQQTYLRSSDFGWSGMNNK